MSTRIVFLLLAAVEVGCASDTITPAPTPPAPPAAVRFALAGSVTSRIGAIANASLEVLDGADRLRLVSTDGNGRYRFTELTPGTFSVRAAFPGYVSDERRVQLQADGVQDFRLTRVILNQDGELIVEPIPNHVYRFQGSVRNDGDACASNVRGNSTLFFNGEAVLTASWNLDPARVLRPNEVATYEFCCLEDRYAGQTGSYSVTYEYLGLAC